MELQRPDAPTEQTPALRIYFEDRDGDADAPDMLGCAVLMALAIGFGLLLAVLWFLTRSRS